MRWFFSVVLLLAFAGCDGPAIKTETISGYQVEYLFEVDGCKMYRFSNGGTNHYFMTSPGVVTTTIRSGETTRHDPIQTVRRPER